MTIIGSMTSLPGIVFGFPAFMETWSEATNHVSSLQLFLWLSESCVQFSFYQLSSFWVLSLVQPLSHSVLNSLKRVVVIMTAVLLLHEHVTPVGIAGVIVTTCGAIMYSVAKRTFQGDGNTVPQNWKFIAGMAVVGLTCFAGVGGDLEKNTMVSKQIMAAKIQQHAKNQTNLHLTQSFSVDNATNDNRKIVLFGAMGRHNFGDMLMPYIVSQLLRADCLFSDRDFVIADVLHADMRHFGGHAVQSVAGLLHPAMNNMRFDVVHLGGETAGCTLTSAVNMILGNADNDTQMKYRSEMQQPHWKHFQKCVPMGYILPKQCFNHSGVFVTNTIGGHVTLPDADEILHTHEYCSVRNPFGNMSWKHLVPDSVVMLKELFDDRISARRPVNSTKYIALQIANWVFRSVPNVPQFAAQLIAAAQHVNASLVFFRAGAAAGHDNLKDLQTIQRIIETKSSVPVEVFSGLNIWDICALISRAEVLVASSLHCRIVAFAYSVPRIAFPVDKVVSFIRLWDSQVADISMSPISQIGSAISQALQGNNAGRFHDKTMARRAVQLYLSSFKLWARMLC